MSSISIIMPCHNRDFDLERVLRTYDAQDTSEPFELIAVDDASTDRTFQVLSRYQPLHYKLKVERLERNQGPATARNRGFERVDSPLVAFVGDDILPEKDFVRGHLEAHRRNPPQEIAILGKLVWGQDLPQNTLMKHIDGVGAEQFSFYVMQDGKEYDFRHLYTSNVSLKTDFLRGESRWFDTDFPYPAFEDAELGYRLAKRGLRIKYQSSILAYHYHYHTIWSFSKRQYYTGMMSHLLLRKHPGLRKMFRRQYYRIIFLFFPSLGVIRPYSTGKVDELEQNTLHLLSSFEWKPNPYLDGIYLDVLWYYYYKGFIQGLFSNNSLLVRVQNAHARLFLAPKIKQFLDDALRQGISLPSGFGKWILQ